MRLLISLFQRLAKIKIFHYFLTRYGSLRIKQICFNEKFSSGAWHFECKPGDELATIVASKANKGKILILGCGTATLCRELPEDCYESILGIDISTVAIEDARNHAKKGMQFITADITSYKYEDTYNVILFSESIYYLNQRKRQELLQTCKRQLSQNGLIIVTIANPLRYKNILQEIRGRYQVFEDRTFRESTRHLIIFR
jgi:SAM-dependent methyltransferase